MFAKIYTAFSLYSRVYSGNGYLSTIQGLSFIGRFMLSGYTTTMSKTYAPLSILWLQVSLACLCSNLKLGIVAEEKRIDPAHIYVQYV